MNRLFLIVNLLWSFCYGQDSTAVKPKEFKRILFGITFSPDYCFRTLKNNNGSDLSNIIINILNQIDRPKFGFTTGLTFCFNFTKCFGLETGVQYSNKGFRTKESALTFSDPIDRRRGFVYNTTNFPTNGGFVYSYHYIDIPFKLNFFAGKKKLRFVSSLGFTTNIFLKEIIPFIISI